MRPERSVMHSPRLTNKNGVETRMAPPNTASGTVQGPIDPSAIRTFLLGSRDRHRNDRERIVPGEESNEDAGETITGREIGVGAALHGRDFHHAGEARSRSSQEADRQDQLAHN